MGLRRVISTSKWPREDVSTLTGRLDVYRSSGDRILQAHCSADACCGTCLWWWEELALILDADDTAECRRDKHELEVGALVVFEVLDGAMQLLALIRRDAVEFGFDRLDHSVLFLLCCESLEKVKMGSAEIAKD